MIARASGLSLLLTCLAVLPARADLLALVHAGGALPVHPSEYGEFWHPGWSIGAGIAIPMGDDSALALHLQYQRHVPDHAAQIDDLLLTGPGGVVAEIESMSGRALTLTSLLLETRIFVPDSSPTRDAFVAIGFGAANLTADDATVIGVGLPPVTVESEADAAFATSFGGGIQWDLTAGTRLTLDSVYTVVFTDSETTHGPSTQFLPLRLGLAFRIE